MRTINMEQISAFLSSESRALDVLNVWAIHSSECALIDSPKDISANKGKK